MAADTFEALSRQVLLRCPALGVFLARQFVSHAFRRVAERRRWSWLCKRGQFITNAAYTTGTVQVTRSSTAVVGTLTVWTAAMVGRTFRIGTSNPIYTIASFTDATHIALDQAWGGASASGQTYEIYNAYVTAPTDFHSFVCVWDPSANNPLDTTMTQEELNHIDPQRSSSGDPKAVVAYAYDTSTPPLPRFELWPHTKSADVYPFLYEIRATDLEDSGASIPRHIRGDMLLDLALAMAARWPGADRENPNPYFNLKLAQYHDVQAERMIAESERQDDETWVQDVRYSTPSGVGLDADYLQKHAL